MSAAVVGSKTAHKTANAQRGEALLELGGARYRLRPSFAALVAAEAETGSLFALVERAAAGALTLGELHCLYWHCLDPSEDRPDRALFGEAMAEAGLAAVTPPLKLLLQQILQGQ